MFAMLPMFGECHHGMLEMKLSLYNVAFLAAVSGSTRSLVQCPVSKCDLKVSC